MNSSELFPAAVAATRSVAAMNPLAFTAITCRPGGSISVKAPTGSLTVASGSDCRPSAVAVTCAPGIGARVRSRTTPRTVNVAGVEGAWPADAAAGITRGKMASGEGETDRTNTNRRIRSSRCIAPIGSAPYNVGVGRSQARQQMTGPSGPSNRSTDLPVFQHRQVLETAKVRQVSIHLKRIYPTNLVGQEKTSGLRSLSRGSKFNGRVAGAGHSGPAGFIRGELRVCTVQHRVRIDSHSVPASGVLRVAPSPPLISRAEPVGSGVAFPRHSQIRAVASGNLRYHRRLGLR